MGKDIYKKGLLLLVLIVIILMSVYGYMIEKNKSTSIVPVTQEDDNYVEEKTQVLSNIVIDINGAVKNPGIYELKEGMRLNDAINAAGGFTEDANLDYISKHVNKARVIVDGEKIYLPKVGEEVTSIEESSSNNDNNNFLNTGKININTASKSQLTTLKGIGETYAQRIIDYRNNKRFSSIEDIKNVKGIGDKTFEQIKDDITIE